MKKIIYLLLIAVSWINVSGQTEKNWEAKVAPGLWLKADQDHSTPFLIILSQQADVSPSGQLTSKTEKATFVFNTLFHHAHATQRDITHWLEQRNISYQGLYIVNAIRTEGNIELIQSIALRPDVERIIDDPEFHFAEPVEEHAVDDDSRQQIEWGIDMIRADEVWAMGYRGQGVTVGGEDTGYEWFHPALKNQYRGYNQVGDTVDHNYNWHDAIHEISPLNGDSINPCGLDSPEPCDDRGHGTHTMGTMIGLDGENEIGVAPEAKWCGCRNMERGWGSPFTYLECFQWFLAPTDLSNQNPDPSKSPHVINNSWSCPEVEGCDSSNWHVMNMAVNNLRMAGTVVVVSAGNNGSGCGTVSTPAGMYEGSLTVGATAINDTIAGFSSRGPVVVDSSFRLKPNVSAPGVNVRSAKPGGEYGSSSGTSMAGPHVAGLVALIISANPALAGQVDTIENIIERTCVPKTTDQMCGDIPGSEVPNNTYGYGRVDALAAVEAALAWIEVNTKDNVSSHAITIYPNPASDHLVIEINEALGTVYFEMVDIMGKSLQRNQWYSDGHSFTTVSINELPAGIYYYQIRIGESVKVGKVVKD